MFVGSKRAPEAYLKFNWLVHNANMFNYYIRIFWQKCAKYILVLFDYLRCLCIENKEKNTVKFRHMISI